MNTDFRSALNQIANQVAPQYAQNTPATIQCPRCNSNNVTVTMVQTGGRSGHRGNGALGHTNNAMRTMAALSTFGMSSFVWKKSKGSSKMKFKNTKMGLCQSCGCDFKVR